MKKDGYNSFDKKGVLDERYSTTKLLVREQPLLENKIKDKFESIFFLEDDKNRKDEGGLRKQGYFKKSYKNQPLVSIVTVVFNGERFLEETIQSVINQTYNNVEYIIIDGGSTDGTLDIIKKYEGYIDYWISEKDEGIYDAMNKGIILCQGEIIGIVNADDFLYLETLRKITEIFKRDDYLMFVYGDLNLIDDKSICIGKAHSIGINNYKYKLFRHMPFLHPSMFIKKSIYKKIGLYDTKFILSADYDYTLRLLKNEKKYIKLDFITGAFRIGGQSGGIKSYLDNHKLLLKHKVSPIVVYFNTIILFTKLILRRIFDK